MPLVNSGWRKVKLLGELEGNFVFLIPFSHVIITFICYAIFLSEDYRCTAIEKCSILHRHACVMSKRC